MTCVSDRGKGRPAGALLVLVAALLPQPMGAQSSTPYGAVVHVNMSGEGGESLSTAVLIHRLEREGEVVLYFLTSAHPHHVRDARERRTVLASASGDRIPPEDVSRPPAIGFDVAVLTTVGRDSARRPSPVSLASPHPGDDYVVAGIGASESPVTMAGVVRMVSTRFAVGDRDLSSLAGCLGAPVLRGGAVFGVVAECTPGRAPVIALLAPAAAFLRRHVPGLQIAGDTRH